MSASPLLPEACEGMLPYLSQTFGNPQSAHSWGKEAREAVENARSKVARLIGASRDEIYFTSSGSESNNWVIKGGSSFLKKKGNHLITSVTEHVSISNPLKTLAANGHALTSLPVDAFGLVDLEELKNRLQSGTILTTIHHAQSEIGTLQPLQEIARIVKSSHVLFHSDGTAAAGVIPVDVKSLGVDFYTLSAQSVYGPKGAAALYIKKGTRLDRFIEGGNQEEGRRAGLENVPAIVGFGIAAEHAKENLENRRITLTRLRDLLIEGILKKCPRVHLTGHPANRLPNHASFYFEEIEGEALVLLLAKEGVAAATGSSCLSGSVKPPSVLTALGIPAAKARGSLVLTAGYKTTEEEIIEAVSIIEQSVKTLRDLNR